MQYGVTSFANAKREVPITAPLPRKTSYAAQVALQRCSYPHVSKVMVPCLSFSVNNLPAYDIIPDNHIQDAVRAETVIP